MHTVSTTQLLAVYCDLFSWCDGILLSLMLTVLDCIIFVEVTMPCFTLMVVVDYTAAVTDHIQKQVPCNTVHCSSVQPCP